jgi:hypothetical protein
MPAWPKSIYMSVMSVKRNFALEYPLVRTMGGGVIPIVLNTTTYLYKITLITLILSNKTLINIGINRMSVTYFYAHFTLMCAHINSSHYS